MTKDYAQTLMLMRSMMSRMKALPAEMRDLQRGMRKDKRPDLARAKKVARALRYTLTRVAGHNLVIGSEHVERWISNYMAICKRLRVDPPVVQVPRSMRHKFGRTVGGKPKSLWDTLPDLDFYQTALAHNVDKILSVTEKAP